jgi:hypothetical protein
MATKKKSEKQPRGTKPTPTLTAGGKRMGRPPMAHQTVTLAIRAPAELVDALDAYASRLAAESPWSAISRNDAARRLMMRGLADLGLLTLPPAATATE